jgi:nitrile hydratase subunit beta
VSFVAGDEVVVSTREHAGHHRTPGYLKGRRGTVLRAHARFRNPESRAYGGDGLPEQRLYLVRFALPGADLVLADVFEHWLEEAA